MSTSDDVKKYAEEFVSILDKYGYDKDNGNFPPTENAFHSRNAYVNSLRKLIDSVHNLNKE